MMKVVLFSIFLFIGNLTFGQTFEVDSKCGPILLNSNYINIEPFGVERIKVKNINPPQVDIFAWSWVGKTFEYHFEVHPPDMFLVKTLRKSGNIIQVIKILKTNDIKK